jgi:7-carboxy-7-deazaguanine synthase
MDTGETALNLIELFRSVQGETSFAGLPTTFIRLARCNLRCTWCDTSYSFRRGTPHAIGDILQTVEAFGCRHVCVTGGEPLLQPQIHALLTALCDRNYVVSLETSGSLSTKAVDPRVRTILDVKCPGSGMHAHNHWPNIVALRPHDEVKFVLADRADYDYAKEIVVRHGLDKCVREVLFSPAFGLLNAQDLVSWILEDRLSVRLNMQVHKWIWSPDKQGV